MEIIGLLIRNLADLDGLLRIGANDGTWWFHSPLSCCVVEGDIEAATLLLQSRANPNSVIFSIGWQQPTTALDTAAYHGRLDVTQLLLKVGGLSARPGTTGYEGSIMIATEEGHAAVAELIRQHTCLNEEQFKEDPGLCATHQLMVSHLKESADVAAEKFASFSKESSDRICREGDTYR